MLRFIIPFLLVFAPVGSGVCDQHPLIKDCAITKEYGFMSETFRLYGDVKIVTDPKEHADFRVKLVESPGLAAVYVKKVAFRPTQCGEWRFTDSAEAAHFTVRFVPEGEWEHFTIRFVDSDPGSPY
ncbi:MAG: hypothetical protein LBR10_07160 [Prevotellaceae bacterium]|jgi:hypothetical protein|nr:hypothetical protein [Prevotellaceae bacterium]